MVISRLWSYLRGYVIIKVKGRSPEKFINLATSRGFRLWDVYKAGDRFLVARVEAARMKQLASLLKTANCRASIEERVGLPFIAARALRRKILVAGAVLFCIALYLLSSFIWFIDIDGTQKIGKGRILQVLRSMDIRPGVRKRSVDLSAVERRVLSELREVAWVGASLEGTRLRVEIAEKKLVEEKHGLTDVVAAKDGLIVEAIFLAGLPLVREGDTVQKGQVLIRGYLKPRSGVSGLETSQAGGQSQQQRPQAEGPGLEGAPFETINAKGLISARVWYEAVGEALLKREAAERTGRVCRLLDVSLGDHKIRVPLSALEFEDYEKDEKPVDLGFIDRLSLPLKISSVCYREIRRKTISLGRDEAVAAARKSAEGAIWSQVPPSAKVIWKREDVIESKKEGSIRVRITLETVEDICKPVERAAGQDDIIREEVKDENDKGGKEQT
ncbi:MAG: sporulation protein YqfD [Firmicutes bacterium]|nr:sporulation protein YqfD [Bacillota bacterium]